MRAIAVTLSVILLAGILPAFAMTDREYENYESKGIFPVEVTSLESSGLRNFLSIKTVEQGQSLLFYSKDLKGEWVHRVVSVDLNFDEIKNTKSLIPNGFFNSDNIIEDGKSTAMITFDKTGEYYFVVSCTEAKKKMDWSGKISLSCSQTLKDRPLKVVVTAQKTEAQKLAKIEADKPEQCKYQMDDAGNCLGPGQTKKPYQGKSIKQMIVQKEVDNDMMKENVDLKQRIKDLERENTILNAKIVSLTKLVDTLKSKITSLLG